MRKQLRNSIKNFIQIEEFHALKLSMISKSCRNGNYPVEPTCLNCTHP